MLIISDFFDSNVDREALSRQDEPHVLDISAFNKLVLELYEKKDSLLADEFEHKLFLISVYAMKIGAGFDTFTKEVDTVIRVGANQVNIRAGLI